MEAILRGLHLLHLKEKFESENITVEAARLMTDDQFKGLGVTVGNATLIRIRCGEVGRQSLTLASSSSSSSSSIARERNNLFLGGRRIAPYSSTDRKARRGRKMSLKFFCLADKNCHRVPSTFTQSCLKKACLGEKVITVYHDDTYHDIREDLLRHFPKLSDAGGFEFMKSISSSREFEVLALPPGGYTARYLKECARQARIYIRPIQTSLDTTEMEEVGSFTDDIQVTCKRCGLQKPETKMRQHMVFCNNRTSTEERQQETDDEDSSDDLPVVLDCNTNDESATDGSMDGVASSLATVRTLHTPPVSSQLDSDTSDHPNPYRSYVEDCIVNVDEESDEEDEDGNLAQAIMESLQSSNSSKETLEAVILSLREKVDTDSSNRINVNRANVWDCAVRSLKRTTFLPQKRLSIHFTDSVGTMEGAIDEGGPRREFLRLLRKALQRSMVFEGDLERRMLSMNATARTQGLYKIAGRMVALLIVHGGVSPDFMSQSLYEVIAYGFDACKPKLEDVADYEIRAQISSICNAVTQEELDVAIENASNLISIAGCIKAVYRIEDKTQMANDLVKFYVVDRCRSSYESFLEGLQTLDLLQAIRKHPDQFATCFVFKDETLTAQKLEELFVHEMSPEGSNRRMAEANTVTFWLDFLLDVQDKQTQITLEDILIFATAMDRVPVCGFDYQPTIEFLHTRELGESERSKLPKANTCACVLKLPIHDTYKIFKEKMVYGILSSPAFGFH